MAMTVLILLKWFLLATAGTMVPCIVLNVDKRLIPWAGLSGGFGYLAAVLVTPGFGIPGFMQVFLGAVVVGALSETFARRFKAPALTFCIPAIFPLVPGITAYQTMQLIVAEKWKEAAASGFSTAAAAFSIAFGLMLVAALVRNLPRKRLHTRLPPSGKPS